MKDDDLALRKRRLSPKLLELKGVSGVGLRDGHVMVYLEDDTSEVQQRVRSVVEEDEPGTPLAFQVTGVFQKR